jgi:hypothetical protein
MSNDQAQNIPLDFIYPTVVQACHEEIRKRFETHILATQNLTTVHVLAGLTLRIVRLTLANKVLLDAGFAEEARMQFRSCVECTVNLLYIMDVGPKLKGKNQDKDTEALAKQFSAYGDVAYAKLLAGRPAQAKRAYVRRGIYTEAQFDVFYQEKQTQLQDAIDNHGCTKSSWHKKDLVTRANLVRDHRPTYVDDSFADLLFSSFQVPNSAVHGDALSLRTQYKELGNAPLEIKLTERSLDADACGQMALWAWKTMAVYYGPEEEKWLNEVLNKAVRAEMRKRFDMAEIASKRLILLPWEV